MARHSCEDWTHRGINCPGGLIREGVKSRRREEAEDDERSFEFDFAAIPVHRRAKAEISADAQAQLALLLELYRRSVVDAVGRPGSKVSIPVELVREAVRFGAQGRELSLWVAAAAATLAVGLRFGSAAAAAVPSLLGGRGGGSPGQGSRGAGGGGLFFEAPTFRGIKRRVDSFLDTAGGLGSGEFFPGILG